MTGNPDKLAEARRLCATEIRAVEVDLPEIQSLDIQTILRGKAEEAYRLLRQPLIVEETGLELAVLNGFPGPLVKWMLAAVGAEGIARTAHSLGNASATARCALLFYDGSREVVGEGTTTGQLVLPPRGEGGFGWDPVFLPDGHNRTYAELSGAEKDQTSHRGHAWRRLTDLLRNI